MLEMTMTMEKGDLVQSLSYLGYGELVGIIKDLDLMIADVGFTEDLIKMLIQSLVADKEDVSLPFINWEKV